MEDLGRGGVWKRSLIINTTQDPTRSLSLLVLIWSKSKMMEKVCTFSVFSAPIFTHDLTPLLRPSYQQSCFVEEINLFSRFLDQKSKDDDDQTEVEEDELSSTMIIVLCVTSFAAIVLIWVTIMVIVWFKRWSAKNTAEHAQAGIPRRPKVFKL